MQLSNNGIELIRSFEGLSLKPYNDTRGYATVGIGHLLHPSPVNENDKEITLEEAYELFRHDSQWAQDCVNHLVDVTINQNQFDALVSFVFNVGSGTFSKSSALKLLNSGDYNQVPGAMALYNKSLGKISAGLVRRREAEGKLFLTV
jgi:lysozyme